MKILCISDTHSSHGRIPDDWMIDADTLVHSGDICNKGDFYEVDDFLEWFSSLDQYKHKIFIAGNHDWPFQDSPEVMEDLLEKYPNVIYLQDSNVVLDGIKFYGSPQTPYFHNWAFNCARNIDDALTYSKPLIRAYWDAIDVDTNVLLTHGPAYGIGDFVPYGHGEFVGCKDLLDVVSTKLLELKLHVSGHIHYSYGEIVKNNVNFINASVVNEQYSVVNKPILIEI